MYWLSVERYDNWLTDKAAGFKFLGIFDRKLKTAQQMKAGDYLISYISSGKSSFADIRKIISDHPSKFKKGLIYDEPFPYVILTEPYIILDESDWIKIHDVLDKLTFLPIEKDWRQMMRNSLRKLNDDDALFLINLIKSVG